MHLHRSRTPLVLLALAALASCASSGPRTAAPLGPPPASFRGFPEQTHVGLVVADARFYANHEEVFDDDLIDDLGVVPVALRIGLKGERQDEVPVRPSLDSMDLLLYLQDGTTLSPVLYTEVNASKTVKQRIESVRFQEDLLTRWENAKEGFVFFRLEKGAHYEPDDYTITHEVGGHTRTVDLTKSVCSFSLMVENEPRTFFVGIKKDRRAAAR